MPYINKILWPSHINNKLINGHTFNAKKNAIKRCFQIVEIEIKTSKGLNFKSISSLRYIENLDAKTLKVINSKILINK